MAKYFYRFVIESTNGFDSYETEAEADKVRGPKDKKHIGIYTRNEKGFLNSIVYLHPDENEEAANKLLLLLNPKVEIITGLSCTTGLTMTVEYMREHFINFEIDPMAHDSDGLRPYDADYDKEIACYTLFGHFKEEHRQDQGCRVDLHDGTEKECEIHYMYLTQLIKEA